MNYSINRVLRLPFLRCFVRSTIPALALTISFLLAACAGSGGALDDSAAVNEQDFDGLEFFVSPDGSDGYDGSKGAPFATLERARDTVRQLLEGERESGIRITLRGGVYQRESTFRLGQRDSGVEGAPVIYRAYPGERVDVTGGLTFRLAEFSPVTDPDVRRRLAPEVADAIVQLNLRERGITQYGKLPLYGHSMGFLAQKTSFRRGPNAPELFFKEQPLTLARWPDEDFAKTGEVIEPGDVIRAWMPDAKGGGALLYDYVPEAERNDPPLGFAFRFDRERLERWAEAPDIRLYGYWFYNWSDQAVEVAKIDVEAGSIHSVQPSGYSVQSGQRFYAYNLLEELDRPGEWYLDRDVGILYLYPPETDLDAQINLSLLLQPLVEIKQAEHIIFDGIAFGYTRGNGIVVKEGRHVTIRNCRIGNIGNRAVFFGGGQFHRIEGCEVFNIGGPGIMVEGGVAAELTPSGHVVSNNLIHNFGRIEKTYNPAVGLSGVGHVMRHNEIHNGAHLAIQFSGNNHLIEFNYIHDVARETDDMAAIYAGRSWTSRGGVIRYNLISNITGYRSGTHRVSGVYLDDGMSGTTVEGNIFLNVAQGLLFNGGRNNTSNNNLFIDVENMMRSTSLREAYKTWASMTWTTLNEDYRDSLVNEPAWRRQFPELKNLLKDDPDLPKYTVIRDNLRYNAPIIIGDRGIHDVVVEFGNVDNNIETSIRPGDFNPESGRFEFNPDSDAFDKIPALREIPVDRIGRLNSR
jgi:hypothetical protein